MAKAKSRPKSKAKNPTVRTRRWKEMQQLNPLEFHTDPALLEENEFRGGVLVHTPIPIQSIHLASENPCVRAYGFSSEPAGCWQCKKLQRDVGQQDVLDERGRSRTLKLHVCSERGETHAPHITHESSWPACARFERIEETE